MRESISGRERPSSIGTAEICSRNFRSQRRRIFFRTLAKLAYPKQTAYELRILTKERYAERTIYDWIAGRSDVPLSVCMQVLAEILAD